MDKRARKAAQRKGIQAAKAKGLYPGRPKGSVTFDVAMARQKVAAMYAEARELEAKGWGDFEKLKIKKSPRKRIRKYYRGGRTWDWWSWTVARKKEIAEEFGISLRTLRRHTDDLRDDEPPQVDLVAVMSDTLRRIPRELLADLGIELWGDGYPSPQSKKAALALLEVFQLAAEWE